MTKQPLATRGVIVMSAALVAAVALAAPHQAAARPAQPAKPAARAARQHSPSGNGQRQHCLGRRRLRSRRPIVRPPDADRPVEWLIVVPGAKPQIPNPGGTAHSSQLLAVTALASNNAWAAGYYTKGTAQRTLILHWNGKTWKRVKVPILAITDTLTGVAAVSPATPGRPASCQARAM